MYKPKKIAFIGAGAMGSALIGGILNMRRADTTEIIASDPDPAQRERVKSRFGVEIATGNEEAIKLADLVFVCVKPQVITSLLGWMAQYKDVESKIFISIAAGVPTALFKQYVPDIRLIRIMPNSPCLIGEGAGALTATPEVPEDAVNYVLDLMNGLGVFRRMKEDYFDAVTGLSGSGPAYVYIFIDALADAGVAQGLSRPDALALAAKTVLGAAKMVIETGRHPMELKEAVTSPGGTTIHGIEALELGGFRGAVFSAVRAATERSRELQAMFGV